MNHSRRRFLGMASDRKGVSAAEYAILAVGVILVIGTALVTLRGRIRGGFILARNAMSSVISSAVR